MATNLIKTTEGTPIVWANTTDYSNTLTGLSRTAQIDLTSIATTAARQGAKVDLGATRAQRYIVYVGIEMDVAPASNTLVEFRFGESPHATAGNANPGGMSGADAAYTGTAGDALEDSIHALRFIGSLVMTADAATVVQYGVVGILEDPMRYVMPLVINRTAQAFEGNATEMLVALIPLNDDIQASA